uniref:Uncharacterized protein n=1 Tax=Triticum urartu TaxID=4572 RepID=A0A8R7PTU0_TRIUA
MFTTSLVSSTKLPLVRISSLRRSSLKTGLSHCRSGTRPGRRDSRVLVSHSTEGQIAVCLFMMSMLTSHLIRSTHGMMSSSIRLAPQIPKHSHSSYLGTRLT